MYGIDVDLTDIENLGDRVDSDVRSFMMDAATRGFAEADHRAPHDDGKLQQSAIPPEWRGDTLVWGFDAPYAEAQDQGTQPYWAPAKPLVEWAERIGKDEGFGYYVQWKIAQDGIDAKRFMAAGAAMQERYLQGHDVDL